MTYQLLISGLPDRQEKGHWGGTQEKDDQGLARK